MTQPQLQIKDVLAMLQGAAPEQLAPFVELAKTYTAHLAWVTNPGPQQMARQSLADQLLFGGQAGGGKSDLLIGLAVDDQERSLILRRQNNEVHFLVDRTEEILGTDEGLSKVDKRWYLGGDRLIMYGGCQNPGDERKYKGEPKDFIGIDEGSEFLESQVNYVIQWLRTKNPKVRQRLVISSNPPDRPEGEWLTRWFAPWVDPDHPLYPQPDGKLLWFERVKNKATGEEEFRWSEEPFDVVLPNGKTTPALSRTFVRSTLDDNPDLVETNYAAQLASAPEELRARYERGEFVTAPKDDDFQVFPTLWVMTAQQRWKEMAQRHIGPPPGLQMTAIGVDIAQGGADRTVLAPRYGEWFDNFIVRPGADTPDGSTAAGLIIQHMRDAAQINLDFGGGWGSATYEFLKGNELVSCLALVPSAGSNAKSQCGKYGFLNLRAEMAWHLREALDPSSNYRLAIPPDPEIKRELCAMKWRLRAGGIIQVEEKVEIKKKLNGKSPDKGDAIILAWYSGASRARKRGTTGRVQPLPRMTVNPNRPTSSRYARSGRNRAGTKGPSDGGEQS